MGVTADDDAIVTAVAGAGAVDDAIATATATATATAAAGAGAGAVDDAIATAAAVPQFRLYCRAGSSSSSSMTTHLWKASSLRSLPPVVLDIQCFQDNTDEYIVKEVCVVDINSDTLLLHHIVGPPPPCDYVMTAKKRRETYWLTKHCHGLEWHQGANDIQYAALFDKLRTCLHNRSVIYVKGLKKKQFVEKYLLVKESAATTTRVIDMHDIGCQSLDKVLSPPQLSVSLLRCGQHKSARHKCALANCTLLKAWLKYTVCEQ